ncbi:MAG: RNA polymerase factor sigma-70 [Gammaproteobacteria bacterium]|nr:RNA polymerase factor sigma-70 [Gammaproteobacteria bacterium]
MESAAPPALSVSPLVSSLVDADFLEDLRRQMVKFATLQLRDAQAAEDAVQDALIGALKNAGSFDGRAALKTWIFAILRNKIADVLRHRHRMVDASSRTHQDGAANFDELFDANGSWHTGRRPGKWTDPEASLDDEQFWRVFEACLEDLPGDQARVFMLREYIELDTAEICATLGITRANMNVMLYRSRLRLRECLERRWFARREN